MIKPCPDCRHVNSHKKRKLKIADYGYYVYYFHKFKCQNCNKKYFGISNITLR